MMDKTGTLTEGNFSVNHYESFKNDLSNDTILSLFASLESQSNHPLAISIVDFAKSKMFHLLIHKTLIIFQVSD